MKLNELTEEQEIQLSVFRDEYLKIGLNTCPINKKESERIISSIYKDYLSLDKPYIWYCDSPLQAQYIINILKANLGDNLLDNLWVNLFANLQANLRANLVNNLQANLDINLRDNLLDNLQDNLQANLQDNLGDNLRDNLWSNLGDSLGDNLLANLGKNLLANLGKNLQANLGDSLGDNLGDSLGDNLRDNLQDNLWDNLWSNLGANLWDNLGDNLWYNLRDNLWDNLGVNLGANLRDSLRENLQENLKYVSTCLFGSIEAYWVAFYMFPMKYMGIDYGKKLNDKILLFDDFIRNCGVIYTFKNICFVCENPIEINKSGMNLHADGKPAIRYKDGYEVFCLNGVNVPKELALTPAEQLDISFFNNEKNADVRTEFVRKYGIDKMLNLGKEIDTYQNYNDEWWHKSEYKLIDMSAIFSNIDYAPHVYMKNQTVEGVYHLEPVSPNCRNLKTAMDEREQIDTSKYRTINIK